MKALVRDMHGALQDYCSRFWVELCAGQLARGLVATPFPLCSMSLGVHLSALWDPDCLDSSSDPDTDSGCNPNLTLALTLTLTHRRP